MKYYLPTVLILFMSANLLSGQGAPAPASGYRLVYSDDFSALRLSPDGYGQYPWYQGLYFENNQPMPGQVTAGASGLDLRWELGGGNDTSIEGCAHDASYCNTFRYGYFEARMKWDVTPGAWPAFWLIPVQGVRNAPHVGEIDIFEGQGSDPNHFYGTVNEWQNGALINSNLFTTGNTFLLPAGNDFSQWHTYGVLWVPGRLTWYFDNQPVGTATTPAILDQEDLFIILGSQEGNHWVQGGLTGVTASSINLDVQWVHVYQSSKYPSKKSVASALPVTPLTILSNKFPAPNAALPYAVKTQIDGGTPPYSFKVTSGALPSGLQLDPVSGIVSNIPGAALMAGSYTFVLQVTDAAQATAQQTFSGVVSASLLGATFKSYPLSIMAGPNGLAVGPDGCLWFTTLDRSVGRLTTAGALSTESVSASTQTSNPDAGDIVTGVDGKIWSVEQDGNSIWQMNARLNTRESFVVPTNLSGTSQLAAAIDGGVWFTEKSASKLGHVDSSGNITEFPTLTPSSQPSAIAETSDGFVAFTELAGNKIGYMSGDGSVSHEIAIPTPNALASSLVVGPDKWFWFTESGADQIGRMNREGDFQEVHIASAPKAITTGPDGALYFTEPAANKIGRITVLGDLTEVAIPDANSGASGITTGPDGAIWFSESNLSRIGRMSFVLAPAVSCAFTASTLTVGSQVNGRCTSTQGIPPYSFGGGGNPPPGIMLNAATGAIYGTVAAVGNYTFYVSAHDSSVPSQAGLQSYSLTVTAK